MQPARVLILPMWLLAVVSCVAALKIGASVLAPIVLALVIGVVLSPVSRRIDSWGVPRAVGSSLTLFVGLLLITGLFVVLEPVVSNAIARAPQLRYELRDIVVSFRSATQGFDQVSADVADALGDDAPAGNGTASEAVEDESAISVPTISDALFYAPGVLAAVMIFVATLYFFLLSRREVYDWISASPSVPLQTADLLEAEREVSRYFLTITMINGGFGLLVTGMLMLWGMPYAALWGLPPSW